MSSSNLIRRSRLAVGGLLISGCLICAAGTAWAHTTGLVEAYTLYGSYNSAFKAPVAEETPRVAQAATETTAAELKTQSAVESVVEAEPDPEEAKRNVGGGNAPAWFLIALGLVVAVILALGLLRRR